MFRQSSPMKVPAQTVAMAPRHRATVVIGFSLITLATFLSAAPAARAEVGAANTVSAGIPACVDPRVAPDQATAPCTAILSFQAGASASTRAAAVRNAGAATRFDFDRLNATSVVVPTLQALDKLAGDSSIAQIIPNRRVHTQDMRASKGKPPGAGGGGGGGSQQVIPEGVARIGADNVWGTTTGLGVDVFIVDTGIDRNHEDLSGAVASNCFNAFDGTDTTACLDDNGHGTHVAGIVGARDNDLDVVGVAPQSTLHAVKVLDASGSGSDDDVMFGLNWVSAWMDDHSGALAVVNMSLGRPGDCLTPDNPLLAASINALEAQGVTVVVAAGNDNGEDVDNVVPAGCSGVLAVASTSAQQGKNKCKVLAGDGIAADTASYFSNQGARVLVSAPGETKEDNTCGTIQFGGITSLAVGGGVTQKAGTSMAAPHVAGVAALLLEAGAAPGDIAGLIANNAEGQGSLPLEHPFATWPADGIEEGVLDAVHAVNAAP